MRLSPLFASLALLASPLHAFRPVPRPSHGLKHPLTRFFAKRSAPEPVDPDEEAARELAEKLIAEFGDRIPTVSADEMPRPLTEEEALAEDPMVADFAKGKYLRGFSFGMDDPLDAPWRVEVAAQVQNIVLESYPDAAEVDVRWDFGNMQVTVTATEEAKVPLGSAVLDMLTEAIRDAYEPEDETVMEDCWLHRHALHVCTPGIKDVLTTQKDFDAFKGFDVLVKTHGLPPAESFEGVPGKTLLGALHQRTTQEVHINQKGRIVKIPWVMVQEVRLPKAETEEGDVYTGEPLFSIDVPFDEK